MLARLQDQSSGLQAEAQRGSDMINNFDLEKQMYSGAESAYRLGHEQLNTLVGTEVVQGLHQGISPIYKTGKALVQRAQGLPTSLAEARSRAQQSASEKLSQVSGRPPVQRAADPLPEGGLREDSRVLAPSDRAERNLRYNPQEGTIETEGGARATIGNERDIKVRTPAEQAEFDSPSVSGRNLPRGGAGPQERVEYPDFGPRTFQAPTQAEHTARLTAERESALPHTAQPDELPDLPGIGSGEPTPASIGTQRVAGEVQPGEGSTYSRGSYRVNPKSTKSKPSAIEEDAEPDLGSPLEFENKRMGVTEAETAESQEPTYSGISQRPNPGYRDAPDTSVGDTSVADTTRSPLLQSESTSVDPRAPPTQPEAPGAIDDMFPNVPGGDEDLNQRISNLRGPTSVDDSGLPELSEADKAVDDTSDVLKSIAQKEAVVAPEEEIADAIPGVGEIIGGIIGIGAAVAGISDAVSASKDKGPTQPGGTPSMSTAFDSAPVIDSSSYHNL